MGCIRELTQTIRVKHAFQSPFTIRTFIQIRRNSTHYDNRIVPLYRKAFSTQNLIILTMKQPAANEKDLICCIVNET